MKDLFRTTNLLLLDCYRWVSICLLALCAGCVHSDVTIDQIEAVLEAPLSSETRAGLAPLLEYYNDDQSNKSLAIAAQADGQHGIGMGYQAPSELFASRVAIDECENWLKTTNRTGQCEILSLGHQVLTPGSLLKGGVSNDTPAMAWKVDTPQGNLYLLGTIHILKPTLLPLPPVFDEFFHAADAVVFETSPTLDTARRIELAALMSMDAEAHQAIYSARQERVLVQFAESQNLSLEQLYSQKPVMNAVQVTQLRTSAIGYTYDTGVEMQYATQAKKLGKPILELETPAEALSTLLELPLELQAEVLIDTIKRVNEVAPGVEEIVSSWLQGDAQAAYDLTVADMVSQPRFSEVATGLLDDRNHQWMEKIDEKLQSDEDFVVMVGSAHLAGEQGLLKLLEQRGFQPIQYSWGGKPLQ